MEDEKIKKAIKLACRASGQPASVVSTRLGEQANYLSRLLSSEKALGWRIVSRVLHKLGISQTAFVDYLEGGLGDPRLHLARLMQSAPGKELRKPNRSISFQKGREKPPVGIEELDRRRDSLCSRVLVSTASWYIANGSVQESHEAWIQLGIRDRIRGNYRRAAYCYLMASRLCPPGSFDYGALVLRMAYLVQACGELGLGESCIREALGVFATVGNRDWLGRAAIDLGKALQFRGENGPALPLYDFGCGLTENQAYRACALHGSGNALMELGRFSEAFAKAELASSLSSGAAQFYVHLLKGQCCEGVGSLGPAMACYEDASRIADEMTVYVGDRLLLSIRIVETSMALGNGERVEREISKFAILANLVSEKFARGFGLELRRVVARKKLEDVREFGIVLKRALEARRSQATMV